MSKEERGAWEKGVKKKIKNTFFSNCVIFSGLTVEVRMTKVATVATWKSQQHTKKPYSGPTATSQRTGSQLQIFATLRSSRSPCCNDRGVSLLDQRAQEQKMPKEEEVHLLQSMETCVQIPSSAEQTDFPHNRETDLREELK